MTLHHWFFRGIAISRRQWSTWVCMAGNCFRQSPLICIFCYNAITEDHHLCPSSYPSNHLHRSEGVDTYTNARCYWILLKDTLLYTDQSDTAPPFFFFFQIPMNHTTKAMLWEPIFIYNAVTRMNQMIDIILDERMLYECLN